MKIKIILAFLAGMILIVPFILGFYFYQDAIRLSIMYKDNLSKVKAIKESTSSSNRH